MKIYVLKMEKNSKFSQFSSSSSLACQPFHCKPPSIPQATQTTNQFGGNQFEIQTKTEFGFGFTISYEIVFMTV